MKKTKPNNKTSHRNQEVKNANKKLHKILHGLVLRKCLNLVCNAQRVNIKCSFIQLNRGYGHMNIQEHRDSEITWLGKRVFLKMVHNSLETGEGSLKTGSATKSRLCHTKLSHLMFRGMISEYLRLTRLSITYCFFTATLQDPSPLQKRSGFI